MAAAEHAIAINDDIPMELPTLPPNQGLEAFKDIVFGSVSYAVVPNHVVVDFADIHNR